MNNELIFDKYEVNYIIIALNEYLSRLYIAKDRLSLDNDTLKNFEYGIEKINVILKKCNNVVNKK